MSKTQDPRIAPKEMIVTRFKSAQQRRQLRDKDRGPKVTEAKSPPKRGRKKSQRSPRKVAEKVEEDSVDCPSVPSPPAEYYPERRKRARGARRRFLAPPPAVTTVATTNKRKFNTPKKAKRKRSPDLPSRSPSPDSSTMAEMLLLADDTQSLDDEDLMEILTCPSPVWWELPDDDRYVEEAICTRNPDELPLSPFKERCLQEYNKQVCKKSTRKSKASKEIFKNTTNDVQEELKMDTTDFSNDNDFKITEITDERFIKKRKKLENVLGNIKNKSTCNMFNISKKEAAVVAIKDTSESRIDCSKNTINVKENEEVDVKTEDVKSDLTADEAVKVKEVTRSKNVKRISESTEEDIADLTADDDMLLHLENMDIPVESDSIERSTSSSSVVIINDDGNKITLIDDESVNLEDKLVDNNDGIANIVGDSKINDISDRVLRLSGDSEHIDTKKGLLDACNKNSNSFSENYDVISINDPSTSNLIRDNQSASIIVDTETTSDKANDDKAEMKIIEIPKNLPPLKKRPRIDSTIFQSPISYKSTSDDVTETSSVSSHDISDTISDTNVKFIMDDDIDDISDVDTKSDASKDVKEAKTVVENNIILNEEKNIKNDESTDTKSKDYITVYKIVPNDNNDKTNFNMKLKNLPEYSNHVENLKQVDGQSELEDCPLPESKGQLNSFFKKCKNANRKRCTKDNNKRMSANGENVCDTCEPKKSITVASDENVQYCLKCSSIFDTEECKYCLKTIDSDENRANCDVSILDDSISNSNHSEHSSECKT